MSNKTFIKVIVGGHNDVGRHVHDFVRRRRPKAH